MPVTEFATGHALAKRTFSEYLYKYARFRSMFGSKFIAGDLAPYTSTKGIVMSSSAAAPIQLLADFKAGKGDKVRFGLIAPLTGMGVTGDNMLEGTEEPMVAYDWEIVLKQIRHAVLSAGKLSEKRVQFDPPAEARSALSQWMANRLDHYILMALCGMASDDGNVTAVTPTRKWVGGQTAAGAMSTTGAGSTNWATNAALTAAVAGELFGPQVIETVKRFATLTEPVVPPLMIDGEAKYVMLIHGLQEKALRATTEWPDIQKHVIKGSKNPIFTGALGEWNGVILHSYDKMESRYGQGDVVAVAAATYTLVATVPGVSGTVTASANVFNAGMVGDYIVINGAGAFLITGFTAANIVVVADTTSAVAGGGTAGYVSSAADDASQFDLLVHDYLDPLHMQARAVFMGQQAAALAFGHMPKIKTKEFDYGNQTGIAVITQCAAGKPQFNSNDQAVVTVDTQVVPD